MRYRIKEVIRQ